MRVATIMLFLRVLMIWVWCILANGALGGNARAYTGEKRRQPHSFTLLTLANDTIIITSRAAPGFEGSVPLEDVPPTLSGPLGLLRRIDGPVVLRP